MRDGDGCVVGTSHSSSEACNYFTFFKVCVASEKHFFPSTTVGCRSPGLVVKGGDLYSEGCEFKSRRQILDGHFSHVFVV